MSIDGKTALPSGKQLRLSSEEDMERVYHLRQQCDAVLVGIGTILADDPKLTVKKEYVKHPKQPLRVVLDSKGRTPRNALVLNEAASTLIFTGPDSSFSVRQKHVEVVQCPLDKNGHISLESVLTELQNRGIKKLLVEGGGTVLWSFLTSGFVDDFFVYIAPVLIGGSETPTLLQGSGIEYEEDILSLELQRCETLGSGLLLNYALIQ